MAATTAALTLAAFRATGQRRYFNKATATTVAAVGHSHWLHGGTPGAGASPSVGVANGAACSSATAGAIFFQDPVSLRMYLQGVTLSSSETSQKVLCDRLAHVNLAQLDLGGAVTGMTGAARLTAASAGVMDSGLLTTEVTTVMGATDNVFNVTYTNQDGTAGQVTPNFTVKGAAAVGDVVTTTAQLFLPLAAGDRGVRSVESVNPVSGAGATGAWNLVLVRPITTMATSSTFTVDRDFVIQMPTLPEVMAGSCLYFLTIPNGASTTFSGNLHLTEV